MKYVMTATEEDRKLQTK